MHIHAHLHTAHSRTIPLARAHKRAQTADEASVAEVLEALRSHSVAKAEKKKKKKKSDESSAPRTFGLNIFKGGLRKKSNLADNMVSCKNDAFFMAQAR